MSEPSYTIFLVEPKQAHRAVLEAWAWLKPFLTEGRRWVLTIRLETRSSAQNRILHSRISDIARQIQWVGATRDTDTWKRLLMAAWMRTRGEQVELLPAIDGIGVDIVFRRTSKLTRAECVELCDYVMAWGDERQVKWRPASLGREWAAMAELEKAESLKEAA